MESVLTITRNANEIFDLIVMSFLPGFCALIIYSKSRARPKLEPHMFYIVLAFFSSVAFFISRMWLYVTSSLRIVACQFNEIGCIVFYSSIYYAVIFILVPFAISKIAILVEERLERSRSIIKQSPSPFDYVFGSLYKAQGGYLIFVLKDGKRIGGKYGSRSYASSHPNEGDFFIDEVYDLDENGAFLSNPIKYGVIIRRADYERVLVEMPQKPEE